MSDKETIRQLQTDIENQKRRISAMECDLNEYDSWKKSAQKQLTKWRSIHSLLGTPGQWGDDTIEASIEAIKELQKQKRTPDEMAYDAMGKEVKALQDWKTAAMQQLGLLQEIHRILGKPGLLGTCMATESIKAIEQLQAENKRFLARFPKVGEQDEAARELMDGICEYYNRFFRR